jgi:hypothetical protein
MTMEERDLRKRELTIRLKRYRQLEPFVTDEEIRRHIRELEAEVLAKLRKLDTE